mmetsp:Transcript_89937/g.279929  ORF Transcript_89937/g.279929 Transcript_89937/m.279929 type:complete len:245 (-) Transcript_89937:281-1015(-)
MGFVARAAICVSGLLGLAAGNFISPGLGKCLDIKAKKKADGTRQTLKDLKAEKDPINVQLYKCHTQHNQEFEIVGGAIKSASLGYCVTAAKAKANANVELKACDGSDLQQWDLQANNSARLKGTNQCIDVKAAKKADGSREVWSEIKKHTTVNVHLYNCHKPDTKRVNQQWEWADLTSGHTHTGRLFELGTPDLGSSSAGSAVPAMAAAAAAAAGLFTVGLFVGRRTKNEVSFGQADVEMLADQ